MTSISEKLYGLPSPAGTDVRFPQPALPFVAAQGCADFSNYNLWCAQIYAVATGRRVPDNLSVNFFGNLDLSVATFQNISPHIKRASIQNLAQWFGYYAQYYNVNTIPRISALIGNSVAETGYYGSLVENLSYSTADRIHSVFPSHFATVQDAQAYVNAPKDLGDKLYDGLMGNAAFPSDDGYNYRGRGIFQITGKNSYTNFGQAANIDALNHPELVEQPQYAVMSGFWYWTNISLNHYADLFQFESLADIINYGHVKYHIQRKHKGTKMVDAGERQIVPPVNWTERDSIQKSAAKAIANAMLTNVGF